MQTCLEKEKSLPVVAEVDVLVAGGGPAGVGAALGAARNGAKTMLIEQANCLGGMATSGMMSHWCGGTESPLLDEIFARTKASPSCPRRPANARPAGRPPTRRRRPRCRNCCSKRA
ncbi:MAG: FAD-dependent oxidoreductase [Victivallis sp.]